MGKKAVRKRRSFSDEFKSETVKLVRDSGKSVGAIARDLGVPGQLRPFLAHSDLETRDQRSAAPAADGEALAGGRTFAIDILACPDCGGRLRLISTITDSSVIEKILRHLGLPTETARPMPAKVAGWLPGLEPAVDWITE